jgi:hypothetical protein
MSLTKIAYEYQLEKEARSFMGKAFDFAVKKPAKFVGKQALKVPAVGWTAEKGLSLPANFLGRQKQLYDEGAKNALPGQEYLPTMMQRIGNKTAPKLQNAQESVKNFRRDWRDATKENPITNPRNMYQRKRRMLTMMGTTAYGTNEFTGNINEYLSDRLSQKYGQSAGKSNTVKFTGQK